MKKIFYFVVFATIFLSGCLTTAPKGEFSQDTRQMIANSEALIGVCRSLQFTLGNGRILTASVNGDQAASLIGGAGVEIIVPSGKQKVKVTISGLVVDVGVLETTLNASPSSSSFFVVGANNSSLYSDRKVGTTETFTWGLTQVNADEFLKACPQKAIRVRKAT